MGTALTFTICICLSLDISKLRTPVRARSGLRMYISHFLHLISGAARTELFLRTSRKNLEKFCLETFPN